MLRKYAEFDSRARRLELQFVWHSPLPSARARQQSMQPMGPPSGLHAATEPFSVQTERAAESRSSYQGSSCFREPRSENAPWLARNVTCTPCHNHGRKTFRGWRGDLHAFTFALPAPRPPSGRRPTRERIQLAAWTMWSAKGTHTALWTSGSSRVAGAKPPNGTRSQRGSGPS